MPFKSMFKTWRITKFCNQHLNTAIRLSARLSSKEYPSEEEKSRTEHLIFVHLNAARRAFKLKTKLRNKKK